MKNICISYLLIILIGFPLISGDGNVSKFDPFLQRDLRNHGHLELLYRAHPDVASPALSKVQEVDERLYNVIFHGDDAALDDLNIRFNTRIDGLATARVTLYDLLKASHHAGIRQIEMGGEMSIVLDRSVRRINADRVHDGEILNVPYMGRNVILGIIDTGIDFFHPDFRDPVNENLTRILSIWDVQIEPEGNERHPDGFDYGVEYTRDDIQRELRGETVGAIRSVDKNGHGTHVAGIAGGNGVKADGRFTGVAPEAEFIIVAFPDGRFQANRVIDAMNYIFSIAEGLGRPAVVNLSIGGHGGSHDGTAGHELAITFFSEQPGKAIAVAAGNSGNRELHYGQPLAPEEEANFDMRIPSYNANPFNNDDFVLKFLWYESTDIFEITVTSPEGEEISAQSGDSVFVETLLEGAVEINTFNDFTNPKGARIFQIEISTSTAGVPPASGDWNIDVRNLSGVSSGNFNSWVVSSSMERPRLNPNTGREYTVTMPGTAEGAITGGAYVTRNNWVDRSGGGPWRFEDPTPTMGDLPLFSGAGPTRDGRMKPNITAPGAAIVASQSNNANFQVPLLHQVEGYAVLWGTSMAAPHIAGVAAIIFEANPQLTGKRLIEIIQDSGQTDVYTGIVPNNEWGFGKADAVAMFDFFDPTEGVPEDFYLYQNYPNPFNDLTRIRFTIPEPTYGKLVVYDILGRKIDVLIEGEFEPRIYFETFDGSNLSTGVYFYRLETDLFTEVKKMILLR